MQVTVQDGAEKAILSHAVLLYTANDQYSSNRKTVFATVHDVADCGTKKKPNVQIMPGAPITKEGLISALGSLSDEYLCDLNLLPEHLLGFSPKHMIWWRPAGKARVFFRTKELGNKSAVVPHPALLFAVIGGQWSVHALKDSVRPTMDTPLFHAPYFNVYDHGNICVGSAAIPDRLSPSTIATWEQAFFESEFTHVNGQIKKIAHPRGEYAFWKEMLEGKYDDFPTELLVPKENVVLADLLKPIRGMERHHG